MLQKLQNLLIILIVVIGCNYMASIRGQECYSPFDCGNGVNFSYPFWQLEENPSRPYCGYPGFSIICFNGNPFLIILSDVLIDPNTPTYSVRSINYEERTLTVVDNQYLGKSCPRVMNNTIMPFVNLVPSNQNKELVYYSNCNGSCLPPASAAPYVSCLGSTDTNRSFVFQKGQVPDFYDWDLKCEKHFQFPVLSSAPNISENGSNYASILQLGFKMEWYSHPNCTDCEKTGHQCGYDPARGQTCLCSNGWTQSTCSGSNGTNSTDGSNGTNSTNGSNGTNSTDGSNGTNSTDGSNSTRSANGSNSTTSANGGSDTKDTEGTRGSSGTMRAKIIYGGLSGVGALVLIIILVVYWRSIRSHCLLICKWSNKTRQDTNVEVFLENYGRLTLHRYSYSSIKKITNCFKDKIGQGGYGGVFKGKLSDGRFVAVKVLTESKGNGEDFINEVATIGRTNHVNIVSLIGFCVRGPKRALVYEYMPNGSLEKYIYNENTSAPNPLGCERLYEIALGIANGLEYLHRGCNTRILHFDIKPHNILLDKDFVPKISDFGLAKLCLTKDSVVSMLGTRGTVGYIAPEVYCRNFGGVSHKSDVYSYGMLVLEMVGGRKNIDVTAENISEIYFPQWIYNRLEQDGSIGLGGFKEMFEEENIKKMIIIGLWCIQTHPSNRPSMCMVVEMLQKSVEDLQMPPDPFKDPTTSSQPTS